MEVQIDISEWIKMAHEHDAEPDNEERNRLYVDVLKAAFSEISIEDLVFLISDLFGVMFDRSPQSAHALAKIVHSEFHSWIAENISDVIAAKQISAQSLYDMIVGNVGAPESNGDSAPE